MGLMALAMLCVGMFWLEGVAFQWFYPGVAVPGGFIGNVAYLFFVVAVAGFLATSLDGMDLAGQSHAQREAEARLALTEARASLVEASARLVAAQLDPHNVLNVMANVGALIHRDPAKATAMLEAAAGYLRRLLDCTKTRRIALWKEREIIEDYLSVEAIRIGDRLAVEWDWPDAFDDVEIPPILVQPLVENAIKHGLWPVGGGVLHLSARQVEAKLELSVCNTGSGLVNIDRPGATGLENLRQRLAHEYGKAGQFHLASDGPWTVATISIPLENPCA